MSNSSIETAGLSLGDLDYNSLNDEQKALINRKITVRKYFGEMYNTSRKMAVTVANIHKVFFVTSVILVAVSGVANIPWINVVTAIFVFGNVIFLSLQYGSAIMNQMAYSAYWGVKIDMDVVLSLGSDSNGENQDITEEGTGTQDD